MSMRDLHDRMLKREDRPQLATAAPIDDILNFADTEENLVFKITGDGIFELGPSYTEQGAARRFCEWVNKILPEHMKRSEP